MRPFLLAVVLIFPTLFAFSILPQYKTYYLSGWFSSGELIDVNGDGLPDFVYNWWQSSGAYNNLLYINNGQGWQKGEDFEKAKQMTKMVVEDAKQKGSIDDSQEILLLDWVMEGEGRIHQLVDEYLIKQNNTDLFLRHALHRANRLVRL